MVGLGGAEQLPGRQYVAIPLTRHLIIGILVWLMELKVMNVNCI